MKLPISSTISYAKVGLQDRSINEHVYKSNGSFAIFYPRGILHYQLNDMSQPYRRYCIRVDSSYVEDILPPSDIPHLFFILPLKPEELALTRLYLELLLNEPPSPMRYTRHRYLFAIILSWLAPLMRTRLPESAWRHIAGEKQVHGICIYINEHYAERLLLEDIAKRFYISRVKLVRIFRAVLNFTVGDYIVGVRVEKSKLLLIKGLSVQETALKCGFSNASHYIRVFRRLTGITPAGYRQCYK